MLSRRDREMLYKCAKDHARQPIEVNAVMGAMGLRGVVAYNKFSQESTIFTFQHSLKPLESMKLLREWLSELHRWWVESQEVAKRLAEER